VHDESPDLRLAKLARSDLWHAVDFQQQEQEEWAADRPEQSHAPKVNAVV
jgi:hypothetical protein